MVAVFFIPISEKELRESDLIRVSQLRSGAGGRPLVPYCSSRIFPSIYERGEGGPEMGEDLPKGISAGQRKDTS